MKKKILFVTSTRADFGKIKPLIKILKKDKNFYVNIIVTGMHMLAEYGSTHTEIDKFFNSGVSERNSCTTYLSRYGYLVSRPKDPATCSSFAMYVSCELP